MVKSINVIFADVVYQVMVVERFRGERQPTTLITQTREEYGRPAMRARNFARLNRDGHSTVLETCSFFQSSAITLLCLECLIDNVRYSMITMNRLKMMVNGLMVQGRRRLTEPQQQIQAILIKRKRIRLRNNALRICLDND